MTSAILYLLLSLLLVSLAESRIRVFVPGDSIDINVTSVREVLESLSSAQLSSSSVYLFFDEGVYSGEDNVGITFSILEDWFIQTNPGQAITVDCENTTSGWSFEGLGNVWIISCYTCADRTPGSFTFKNCKTDESQRGGALTYVDTNLGLISDTTFIDNSGNGSAVFAKRTGSVVLASSVAVLNNKGTSVVFENVDPLDLERPAGLVLGGDIFSPEPNPNVTMIFEGNEENVRCTGYANQTELTAVQLTATNIDGVDCCRDCMVATVDLTFLPCQCGEPTTTSTGVVTTTENVGSPSESDDKSDRALAIGLGVGLGGLFVTTAFVAFLLVKKRNNRPKYYFDEGAQVDVKFGSPTAMSKESSSLANEWEIQYDELKLKQPLGQGQFGKVYKAEWRSQEVAVKQLIEGSPSPALVQSFISEATIMMKLRPHKNCLQIYGVCTNASKPLCIVSEYMPTGSLADLLASSQKISEVKLLQMAVDIASGVAHLHYEGIRHRDLAARNLLLDEYWRVKVADYGLANVSHHDEKENTLVPIRWTAPEVLKDPKESSFASDVWSFGVVLYEMWSRKTPYHDISSISQVSKGVTEGVLHLEPPQEMNPQVAALMLRCLQLDPKLRPSFSDILGDLRAINLPEEVAEQVVYNAAEGGRVEAQNNYKQSNYDEPKYQYT